MFACRYGSAELVELLMDEGADVHAQNDAKCTPLMLAIHGLHRDTARLLIDSGVDIHRKNEQGWTALTYACRYGDADLVELLMRKGADIHERTGARWTTLMLAAHGGNAEIASVLVERGVDIHAKNSHGKRALHLAAVQDNDDIGLLLIEKGAEPREHGGSGDHCYGTAKSFQLVAEKSEAEGDVDRAVECYSVAADYSEKATPKLMEVSERYRTGGTDGSILRSLLGLVAAEADLAATMKGKRTDYSSLVPEAQRIDPNEEKRIKYADKSARSLALSLECRADIQRLTGKR